MKRIIALGLSVIASISLGQNAPTFIGHLTNKDGGQIIFTNEQCATDESRRIVFIKQKTGKISLHGCWSLIDSEIFVLWDDGELYSYPVGAVVFNPEYENWYQSRNKPKYQ